MSQGSYGYATFRVSGAKLCAVRVACVVGLVNAFQHCLVRGIDIHKSRVGEALEKAFLPYGQCGGVDKSVVDKIRPAVNCYLGAQYISEKISSELSVMFTLPIEICSQPVKVIIGWGI